MEMEGPRRRSRTEMGDDDVLWEIFARLPPQPSFLLRASLVCPRWRRLATDPDFLRRRWPPIIGVFIPPNHDTEPPSFKCILDPPDSIPPERFALQYDNDEPGYEDEDVWYFRGCRHGRLLLLVCSRDYPSYRQVLVWDPVIEEQRFLYLPPHFDSQVSSFVQGAVLCAAADKGHVHGDCHSSPFKVVLAAADNDGARALACVYSSETDTWGDLITTPVLFKRMFSIGSRTILVGNSIYWFIFGWQVGILEFDLDTERLSMIEVPSHAYANHRGLYLSTLAEGGAGGLGFIVLSKLPFTAQLWVRKTDSVGAAEWILGKTIDLGKLLSPIPGLSTYPQMEMDFHGDDNVMFVSAGSSVFMVHLSYMQFKKIFESNSSTDRMVRYIYPFTSSYPAVAKQETEPAAQ